MTSFTTFSSSKPPSISKIPPLSASSTIATEFGTIARESAATAASSANASSTSSSGQQTNIGALVGGVIGGVALVCFVALGVLFLRKYRSGNAQMSTHSEPKPAWRRANGVPSELAP